MKTIVGDITNIKKGYIAHQVNCQNVMGSGVAKPIYQKYPKVKKEYHKFCRENGPAMNLLGKVQYVPVTEDLTVINIFSQLYFGNSSITGVKYTSEEILIEALKEISKEKSPLYVPHLIGCGLAGGDWGKVSTKLKDYDIITVNYN